MKKKLLSIVLLCTFVFAFAACGKEDHSADSGDSVINFPIPEEGLYTRDNSGHLSGQYNIEIELENYGTISATLDADIAPVTVTNFIDLVQKDFYDGLTFHRIINGYMMQGGCPEGNGYGSTARNIQGEFSENGIENTLSHTRGVLSMARANDPDSGSCQFFIMHQDYTTWDGSYAAFGWVTDGMEIVDAICEDTPVGYNGAVSVDDQPVIKEIRIVE